MPIRPELRPLYPPHWRSSTIACCAPFVRGRTSCDLAGKAFGHLARRSSIFFLVAAFLFGLVRRRVRRVCRHGINSSRLAVIHKDRKVAAIFCREGFGRSRAKRRGRATRRKSAPCFRSLRRAKIMPCRRSFTLTRARGSLASDSPTMRTSSSIGSGSGGSSARSLCFLSRLASSAARCAASRCRRSGLNMLSPLPDAQLSM